MATIDRLLRECTLGNGRIVSVCELTPLQILEAQVQERMHVSPAGYGFVLLPWDQPGGKDQCCHEPKAGRGGKEVRALVTT